VSLPKWKYVLFGLAVAKPKRKSFHFGLALGPHGAQGAHGVHVAHGAHGTQGAHGPNGTSCNLLQAPSYFMQHRSPWLFGARLNPNLLQVPSYFISPSTFFEWWVRFCVSVDPNLFHINFDEFGCVGCEWVVCRCSCLTRVAFYSPTIVHIFIWVLIELKWPLQIK